MALTPSRFRLQLHDAHRPRRPPRCAVSTLAWPQPRAAAPGAGRAGLTHVERTRRGRSPGCAGPATSCAALRPPSAAWPPSHGRSACWPMLESPPGRRRPGPRVLLDIPAAARRHRARILRRASPSSPAPTSTLARSYVSICETTAKIDLWSANSMSAMSAKSAGALPLALGEVATALAIQQRRLASSRKVNRSWRTRRQPASSVARVDLDQRRRTPPATGTRGAACPRVGIVGDHLAHLRHDVLQGVQQLLDRAVLLLDTHQVQADELAGTRRAWRSGGRTGPARGSPPPASACAPAAGRQWPKPADGGPDDRALRRQALACQPVAATGHRSSNSGWWFTRSTISSCAAEAFDSGQRHRGPMPANSEDPWHGPSWPGRPGPARSRCAPRCAIQVCRLRCSSMPKYYCRRASR